MTAPRIHMSASEAAQALSISTQTCYDWLRAGTLQGHQYHPNSDWLVSADHVAELIEKRNLALKRESR